MAAVIGGGCRGHYGGGGGTTGREVVERREGRARSENKQLLPVEGPYH